MNTRSARRARQFAAGADLSIYSVLEKQRELLRLLDDASPLELDLAEVRRIDAAGLQLLILLKREAVARGCQLRLVGCSEPVREAIEFCNLVAGLGEPLAPAD